MAAKIVRRKEKRAEVEAAERKAKSAPKKAAAAKKRPSTPPQAIAGALTMTFEEAAESLGISRLHA